MLVLKRNPDGIDTPNRIRALQEERLQIQMKTFTKWINSYLPEDGDRVTNLFADLSDGKILLRLLQTIAGDKFAQPTEPKFRAHKIENVYKCLSFLRSKVRLESIGPEDIVDGNPILVMGLIWTIIARFEIQEILGDMNSKSPTQARSLTAKSALLLWCKQRTAGYPGVEVVDFSSSWRDGLAFNALVHHFLPKLIQFGTLNASNYIHNLNNAFTAAEEGLGIPKLLDAEDFGLGKPDEKSVITYLSSFYHHCAKLDVEDQVHDDSPSISSADESIEEISDNPVRTVNGIYYSSSGDRPVVTQWTCSTCKRLHPSGVYLCPNCQDRREADGASERTELLPSSRNVYRNREIARTPFALSVTKTVASSPGNTWWSNGAASSVPTTNQNATNVSVVDGGGVTADTVTLAVSSNTVDDKNHGLTVISKFLTRRKLFETAEPTKECKNTLKTTALAEIPKTDSHYSERVNTLESQLLFLKEQYYQQLGIFENKLESLDNQLAKLCHEKSQLKTMLDDLRSNSGELKTKIRTLESSILSLREVGN